MLFAVYEHTHLVGKLCKLTRMGAELEKEYEQLFHVGNYNRALDINFFCYMGGRYEMSLMFIDEKPIRRQNVVWYCVKEVGVGVMGDWHWYTLDQLMISV